MELNDITDLNVLLITDGLCLHTICIFFLKFEGNTVCFLG